MSGIMQFPPWMQDFLENGVYRQPSEDGGPRQTEEKLMRKMARKEPGVPYLVTSKAPDKRSEDWRRVVAVFVTGQTWQFKGWPHEVDSATRFCIVAIASSDSDYGKGQLNHQLDGRCLHRQALCHLPLVWPGCF